MSSSNKRQPISKLAKDKAALAWLDKHRKDPVIGGGFSTATPHHSFPKIVNYKRKRQVDAILDVIDQLNEEEQYLCTLFLEMTPREMAKRLNWPRATVYWTMRTLRNKCVKLSAEKRASLTNARNPDQSERPECPPVTVASRVLELTFGGETRRVYYMERSEQWCDEDGKLLPLDVTEILSNHGEDLAGATTLDVEELL